MKKILLGMTVIAGWMIAGAAQAADMPLKAARPAPPPVYNWTGCYVGAGGGYGMFNQEMNFVDTAVVPTFVGVQTTSGGRGWFGTVGVGCDYQFGERWIIGAFADFDFGSGIKGDVNFPIGFVATFGREKEKSAWAVGGRIGYLISPQVLTYFAGGFTEARFSAVDLFFTTTPPVATGITIPRHTFSGWFVGGGFEYNLGWPFPGLFWKTEYRFADYDRDAIQLVATRTGAPITGAFDDSRKFVQTVRTELVWRFNWAGPVRAAY
jgi:outer membrane immunogenic protein